MPGNSFIMPDYTYPYASDNTVLWNLNIIRDHMTRGNFHTRYNAEQKRDFVTAFFAARMAAGAEDDRRSSLDVVVSAQQFSEAYEELRANEHFQAYLDTLTDGGADYSRLIDALTARDLYGAAQEEAFRAFFRSPQAPLPADVPTHFRPTAREQIERQIQLLRGLEPNDERAIGIYAEIFRCRQAVGAGRNEPEKLARRAPAPGKNEASLAENRVFREFLEKNAYRLYRSFEGRTHGGAAEDMFKEYILYRNVIPGELPARYLPTLGAREKALQGRIGAAFDTDTLESDNVQMQLIQELLATRDLIEQSGRDAVLSPAALSDRNDVWRDSGTFQEFVSKNLAAAGKAAAEGGAARLVGAYKRYIVNRTQLPEDVPDKYLPTAKDRLTVLRTQIGDPAFSAREPGEIQAVFTELMAARSAVNAVRGGGSELRRPLTQAALKAARAEWDKCYTFQSFLQEEAVGKTDEFRPLAVRGFGGAIVERFKDYLVRQDRLEQSIPAIAVPSARARMEALREKLGEEQNADGLLRIATEATALCRAMGIRPGQRQIPNEPIRMDALNEARSTLEIHDAPFAAYIRERIANRGKLIEELRNDPGSLQSGYRAWLLKLPVIPANTPAKEMPSYGERVNALREQLRSDEAPNVKRRVIVELLSTLELMEREGSGARMKPEAVEAPRRRWNGFEAFREYLEREPDRAGRILADGSPARLLGAFRRDVANRDTIPENVPDEYLPNGKDRLRVLRDKIKADAFRALEEDRREALVTELLATRFAVEAVRGSSASLKKPLTQEALAKARAELERCGPALQGFVEKESAAISAAAAGGHGGAVEDRFREFLTEQPRLQTNLPARLVPSARARMAALQEMLRHDPDQDALWRISVEMTALRRAADAAPNQRRMPDSPIPMDRLEAAREQVEGAESHFTRFIEEYAATNPGGLAEALRTDFGSGVEADFTSYLANQPAITADMPAAYLPSVAQRLDGLDRLLRESPENDPALLAEAMATRLAADAVRGSGSELKQPVDVEKLEAFRTQLLQSESFGRFVRDEKNKTAIREASREGGEALTAAFRRYINRNLRLPADVPAGLLPSLAERAQLLQNGISDLIRTERQAERKYREALAANDERRGRIYYNHYRGLARPNNAPERQQDMAKEREELEQAAASAEEARKQAVRSSHATRVRIYAQYLAARRAAALNAGNGPDAPLDREEVERIAKSLETSIGFQDFVVQQCNGGDRLLGSNDGQGLEAAFRKHIARMTTLPEDLDPYYLPTGLERISALQEQIRGGAYTVKSAFSQRKDGGYTFMTDKILPTEQRDPVNEIMYGEKLFSEKAKTANFAALAATRQVMGASDKTLGALSEKVDPHRINQTADFLRQDPAFRDFARELADHPAPALSPNGSGMEQAYKNYILNCDLIPKEVSEQAWPNALERINVLKRRIGQDTNELSLKSKCTELLAARIAVNAVRGEKESLNKPMDCALASKASTDMTGCQAIEDYFLPSADAMRTAPEKKELEQKLAKESDQLSAKEREKIEKHLREIKKQEKGLLQKRMTEIKKAVASGHGGALEDQLKEHIIQETVRTGVVPAKLPKLFRPSPEAVRQQIEKELADPKKYAPRTPNARKEWTMRRAATAVYMYKKEKDAKDRKLEFTELDHNDMSKKVSAMMRDRSFRSLFASGDDQQIAGQIVNKQTEQVYDSYKKAFTDLQASNALQPVRVQTQPRNRGGAAVEDAAENAAEQNGAVLQ